MRKGHRLSLCQRAMHLKAPRAELWVVQAPPPAAAPKSPSHRAGCEAREHHGHGCLCPQLRKGKSMFVMQAGGPPPRPQSCAPCRRWRGTITHKAAWTKEFTGKGPPLERCLASSHGCHLHGGDSRRLPKCLPGIPAERCTNRHLLRKQAALHPGQAEADPHCLAEHVATTWQAQEGSAASAVSWEHLASLKQAQDLVFCLRWGWGVVPAPGFHPSWWKSKAPVTPSPLAGDLAGCAAEAGSGTSLQLEPRAKALTKSCGVGSLWSYMDLRFSKA